MSARWTPFAKHAAVIGSILVAVWVLTRVSLLLVPICLALLLAYLVSFPVGWIIRHTGWPRAAVVAIVYLLVVLILITAPLLFVPRLMALFGMLRASLAKILAGLSATTPTQVTLAPNLSIDLAPFYASVRQEISSLLQFDPNGGQPWASLLFPFANRAVRVVSDALTSLAWSIITLTISFYVAKDAPAMGRFIGSRIPEPWQPELDRLWHELTLIWDGYVRGQITLGIVMGVLTWLAMSVLGERNAPAMGLVFFLGEFVPGVGHVIAGVVAVTIALFLGSTWLPLMHLWFAVVIAATYVVLAQLENLYMRPRIIGRRVALHPVVIIVGAVAGARIGGVLGIVLAAPTIASARLLLGYGLRKVLDEEPFPLPSARLSEQDLHWRSLVRERAMAALIFDLDGTLAATDGCLVMQLASRLRHLQAWLPGFRAEPAARFLLSARDWLIHRLDPLLRGLLPSEALTGSHGWLQQAGVDGDLEEALPVAGSVEELSLLAQHYPLALVTDRTNHEVAAFLARAGLTGLFGAIITRNELHALPPHPAEIDMAARRLGVAAGSCVVVGDAPADLRAARAAGAMAIGVLTGFGGSEEMAPADLVIPSVACLHDYLPLSQRAGFGGPYAPPGLEIGSRAACRVPKR